MDADGWRRIFASKNFSKSSDDLCKAFAAVIKRICVESNLSESLEAFLSCRLIPLDKNPGLRPIGVGEILRRIAGKVVVSLVRGDVISSVGSLQVCGGHEAGCEAAIHAMHTIFEEENTEAIILIDAANAFNSINRNVFLHNISIICPAITIYVHNCYSLPSRLFVIGGFEIKSCEGTTQGDPIAMSVYAIAIIPLMLMVLEITSNSSDDVAKMVAYADDFTAGGTIESLKYWWDTLCKLGPKFGYYPQASKTWLIVKDAYVKKSNEIFKNSSIQITSTGQRHLGAVIGTTEYKQEYMNEKITTWTEEIRMLSEIAKTEPQSAYICFTSGFKHKITYYMRTIPNISHLLQKIDDVILANFIPAITAGKNVSEIERKLLSLPVKLGGLGIPIFSEICETEYSNSLIITENLRNNIIQQNRQYEIDQDMQKKKNNIKFNRSKRNQKELENIRKDLNENQITLNNINQEIGASSWLTTMPIKEEGYVITKQIFWDLVRFRYGWELYRMPMYCGCGSKFDIQHALSCKKGGFVSLRHNDVRNITAALLKEVCHDVRVEPILQQLTGETFNNLVNVTNEARLDISARGFWVTSQMAFFDIRVFNPIAKRYATLDLAKSYQVNENEKKKKYNDRVLQVEHGSFTPLVMSAAGGMSRE